MKRGFQEFGWQRPEPVVVSLLACALNWPPKHRSFSHSLTHSVHLWTDFFFRPARFSLNKSKKSRTKTINGICYNGFGDAISALSGTLDQQLPYICFVVDIKCFGVLKVTCFLNRSSWECNFHINYGKQDSMYAYNTKKKCKTYIYIYIYITCFNHV